MDWLESRLIQLEANERQELEQLLDDAKTAIAFWLARLHAEGWEQDAGFNRRTERFEAEVYAILALLMAHLTDLFLKYEEAAYRLGYYFTAYQANFRPPLLDSGVIRGLLQQPYIDATLQQRFNDLTVTFLTKFRRQVTQSQIEEESLVQAMARMNDVEKGLLGALLLLMASELWRAGNDGIEYAIGVVPEDKTEYASQWVTANDERVCPICGMAHMEIARLGSLFSNGFYRPPAHPKCRCLRRLLVRVTNELGYKVWAYEMGITSEDDGTKLI